MKSRVQDIVLITLSLLPMFNAQAWSPDINEPMTPQAIYERTKPVGDVVVSGESPKPKVVIAQALGPNAGKKRYEASCAICHTAGVAGAPKIHHVEDWAKRKEQGLEGLLASAIKGKGGMPPRGTCMSCSDEELRRTIEYMLP
jgi:cytochrome c5